MNELFKKHDWSDVVPLEQYDGQPPLLTMKYNEECRFLSSKSRLALHELFPGDC